MHYRSCHVMLTQMLMPMAMETRI